MYLVYESLYGELQQECDVTNIIGLYRNKEEALEVAKYNINEEIRCNTYVLDEERNDIERDGYVRLFYKYQENWDDFYEVFIKKMEVK